MSSSGSSKQRVSKNVAPDKAVKRLEKAVTAALARVPGLFVISGQSAATYKGKPANIKQVAEEQGVQYVLKGSVQKAGDKLRIIARLVDALIGRRPSAV